MALNFLDLKGDFCHRDKARWVVIPVPYDATTCYRPGARYGPEAILLASPHMEFLDEETLEEPFKGGIHTRAALDPLIDPEQMTKRVEEAVFHEAHEGKLVCTLGGDHSISIGAIRALYREFGPLNIVQFDAHLDLRDTYFGSPFSHACTMRRVWAMGNVVQLGIRSFSREEWAFLKTQKNTTILAKEVIKDRSHAIKRMTEALDPGLPTYITIDLDCLDPAIMPAVGTPEPGGLTWWALLECLKAVTEKTRIVGFDCVELAPLPGIHHPQFTAARLVYKLMAYERQSKGGCIKSPVQAKN